ncbi:MAG: GNAT family N-acetyltransferase [Candidatus Omnitrophota bacterium]|nr:GNAT family N-acetyltransferase [Candidatus Omnitrophota bacterium]
MGKGKVSLTGAIGGGVRLRPARESDAEFLFKLRNDPEVRRSAFNEKPLVWEEHLSWMANKLASHKTTIFIAEVEGQPAGQVRFDLEEEGAVVDITLAQHLRGRGLGTILLEQGVGHFITMMPGVSIVAYVKKENTPSLRCFKKAGFRDEGAVIIQGTSCHRMLFLSD